MEKDPKQVNIVDSHRNMLMFSKSLSEFQTNNLKNWPFVFFEDVKNAKVEWNFIKNDEFYAGVVEFDIEMTPPKNDLGLIHLELATKVMFWSDTEVKIKVNGKLWKTQKSSSTKKILKPQKTRRSRNTSKAAVQV